MHGNVRTGQIRTRGRGLSGSRPAVLLVEDSRTFTTILAHRFETELGLEVVSCATLREMREALSDSRQFMLAVIDLNLADSPNGEVLEHSMQADLPTIVFTATFDFNLRASILRKNVLDYVIKDNDRAIDGIVHAVQRILMNRNIRVLVVDDKDQETSEAVQMLLAQQFLVAHAASVTDAMEKIGKYRDIELVVVGDQLQDASGIDLVKLIRRSHPAEELRIIGFSAKTDHLMSAAFLKAGASDFLHQPFLQEEFQCRVAQSIDTMAQFKKLQAIASRDFLTDTFNRRFFFERGPVLVQHCLARQEPCCAVVLDIDHFKKFNDTYGHETGDLVLKTVARKLREMVDCDTHLIARLGGEEFAILLRNMGVREATEYCDLVREEIARTSIVFEEEELSVNVSIGVAEISGEETFDNYLNAADQYLYMAKNSGRNRVFSDYSITQLFAGRQKAS